MAMPWGNTVWRCFMTTCTPSQSSAKCFVFRLRSYDVLWIRVYFILYIIIYTFILLYILSNMAILIIAIYSHIWYLFHNRNIEPIGVISRDVPAIQKMRPPRRWHKRWRQLWRRRRPCTTQLTGRESASGMVSAKNNEKLPGPPIWKWRWQPQRWRI